MFWLRSDKLNSDKHDWRLLSFKNHKCHITSFLSHHLLKMSSYSTNASM